MNNSPATVNVLANITLFMLDNPDVQFTYLNAVSAAIHFRADTVAEYNATKEAIRYWVDARNTWIDDDTFEIAAWTFGDWRVRLYGARNMPMTDD